MPEGKTNLSPCGFLWQEKNSNTPYSWLRGDIDRGYGLSGDIEVRCKICILWTASYPTPIDQSASRITADQVISSASPL